MKQEHANSVYENYTGFVENFILHGKSYVTQGDDEKEILTKENLSEVLNRYVEKYDGTKGKSFTDKVIGQFDGAAYEVKLLFAHAEWLWAMAVDDIGSNTKKWVIERIIGDEFKNKVRADIAPQGFGSAGTFHKNNKYGEIRFIILLFKYLLIQREEGGIQSASDVNEHIELICNACHYDFDSLKSHLPDEMHEDFQARTCAMYNILTYCAFPDKYERIASDGHKDRIVNGFSSLVDTKSDTWKNSNKDEKIAIIRERLTELTGSQSFDFYEGKFRQVWNFGIKENQFDEIQALNYKKAVILYGPPGTSKTYSAKEHAKVLITQHYLKQQENVKKYFEQNEDFISGRIHRLQLHPNYSFEEFIAGIQLKNNETVVEKGYFLKKIEEIEKDEYPHVIILDEINRIDLSRLFGELFSTLENRGEVIDLSVGDLKIKVPENLYVIGTMNEIDFSLERVDFALRRRFVWYFYGYDEEILREMMAYKNKKLHARIEEDEMESFISRCNKLNNFVSNNIEELGKQYQIGHTFFAEVVDIHRSFRELNSYRNKINLFRKEGAIPILWSISILPMLEAYLGNMDQTTRKDLITQMEKIFLKGE